MKKLFFFLLSLATAAASFGQTQVRAAEIVADQRLFPPVQDTSNAPKRVGELRLRASDTSLYMGISITGAKKWQKLLKLTDVSIGGGDVDSVTLENDTLFYYVGATPTMITPVVPYDFTSLADGDMLEYSAGDGAFINVNVIEIRWKARVGSTTSSATPTINTDNVDIYKLTAQAADITSFTTNLSGTPNDGDILEIQITGTATRAITWGASFVSSTVALPTTTDGTATLTVVLQYFTTSSYGNNKWVCAKYF